MLTVGVRLDFLVNMSASADILAMAKVEVDLSTIPEGKNVCIINQLGPIEILTGTGPYQMARQASLHPPPNSRRDQGGREREGRVIARSPERCGSCQETRMVDYAW